MTQAVINHRDCFNNKKRAIIIQSCLERSSCQLGVNFEFKATYTKLKITAGHWPFSVQFSVMATQNLILFVSNCTDGRSKFHFGRSNPKPIF